jgi:small subunit ribosomal protein S17
MAKKRLQGKVVSDKMAKTVVVKVERWKVHPKYLRRVRVHKNYKAHDENNEYQVGDNVILEETKPMSRDKRWLVISKV